MNEAVFMLLSYLKRRDGKKNWNNMDGWLPTVIVAFFSMRKIKKLPKLYMSQ
jgi:hypothetical protein